jgi:hypothetical protein
MIGKIFTFNYGSETVYVRIVRSYDNLYKIVCGKVIKSDCAYMYLVGYDYDIFLPIAEEVSEQDFNKIVVFEWLVK